MHNWLNRSPSDIAIYILIVVICSLILAFGFVYYIPKYKKEKKQIFTLRKIVIFSLYFSFFIAQALITRFISGAPIIPFSLDNITVIAVGFLFGPLEGLIYGIIADLTRVGINAWVPQLLPAFGFAILGLLSGMFGREFFKKPDKEISDFVGFFGMQLIIFFFVGMTAIAMPLLSFFSTETYNDVIFYAAMTATILSLIAMEFLLLFARKSSNRKHMKLIMYITLINAIDRIFMGYLLRSFAQYWYWGYPFGVQLLGRMITGSYLVPLRTIASIGLIKASLFAIEQRGGIKNWV